MRDPSHPTTISKHLRVDPILMGSALSFIIARSLLDAGDAADLIGEHGFSTLPVVIPEPLLA
jgi:hypothetical protein